MESNPQVKLQVAFSCEQHDINIETLIVMLEANQAIYRYILTFSKDRRGLIDIKVSPPEKGSFLIDLILEWSPTVGTIIKETNEIVSILGGYVGVGVFVWSLFKKRNGTTVKQEEKNRVINQIRPEFNVTHKQADLIIKVYNNRGINSKMAKAVKIANNDTQVNGITFTSSSTSNINFDKKDLSDILQSKDELHEERIQLLSPLIEIKRHAATTLANEGLEPEDSEDQRYLRYAKLFYQNRITKPEFVSLVREFTNRIVE